MLSNLFTVGFLTELLSSGLRMTTPILYTSLGEVFSERAGITNIGLEGLMVMGAVSSFIGVSLTGSLLLGVLIAIACGVVVNALFAYCVIYRHSDQIVMGMALNILAAGFASFLYRAVFGISQTPEKVAGFQSIHIPVLSDIPVIGPVIFSQNILLYLALVLVPVCGFVLFRTPFGLHLRSVGEYPKAADSMGIKVYRMRFLGCVIGYFVLTPLGLATGLFQSMAEADAVRSNLGIGLMIGTGLGVAIKAVVTLIRQKKSKGAGSMPRRTLVIMLVLALMTMLLLAVFTEITILECLLLIVGVYLATYLSGMLTGQTGVNPMEIFAILVLLGISAVLSPSLAAAFSIAGVVAVACGLTGDVMNDLKSGSLIGTEPRYQIIAEGIGGIIGAVIAALSLIVLKEGMGGFGSPELPAPQAAAVAAMATGLESPAAFFIGAAIGIVLFLLRVPSATIGLGVYLPTYISSAMALGAVIMAAVKKAMKDKGKADETASLVSSGLLGGEGITGVIIAIFSMF